MTHFASVHIDGGLDVWTFEEEPHPLFLPCFGYAYRSFVPGHPHVVSVGREEERIFHVALCAVFLHEGIEVVGGIVGGTRPHGVCRHLHPLPVGLHGSWQADEAVIGGLGTCAEVQLAGEVNVLLCLHAFHASGKKETDEGQELFHRCFR